MEINYEMIRGMMSDLKDYFKSEMMRVESKMDDLSEELRDHIKMENATIQLLREGKETVGGTVKESISAIKIVVATLGVVATVIAVLKSLGLIALL